MAETTSPDVIMKFIDARPDGFWARMFLAALQGAVSGHDLSPENAVEFSLKVCCAFMDRDQAARAALALAEGKQ